MPLPRLILACWSLALTAIFIVPAATAQLHDDARVFSKDQSAALLALLTDTRVRTGVEFRVITFTYVSGGLKSSMKSVVEQHTGGAPGLVLAYNRGESLPALQMSPSFWERYPSDEVASILHAVSDLLLDLSLPVDERLFQTARFLHENLLSMESGRLAREEFLPRRELYLAAALGGVLLVLGLIGGLLARRMRQGSLRALQRHEFPDVEVGLRLGAAHGGGVIAEHEARPQGGKR